MADETTVDGGLLVYFFAPLIAIFLGPLEAVLAVVGYWLIRGNDKPETTNSGSNRR